MNDQVLYVLSMFDLQRVWMRRTATLGTKHNAVDVISVLKLIYALISAVFMASIFVE